MTRILWPVTRVAINLIVLVAATLLVLWLFGQLRLVIVPVLVSLLIATLLVPPVELLRRHGWPSAIATLVVMLVSAAAVAGIVALIAPAFVDQFGDLTESVEEAIDEVIAWLISGPFELERSEIDRAVEDALASLRDNSGGIGRGVLSGATILVEVIAGILLALVLVFFFVHDGRRMWGWVVSMAPERHREVVDGAGQQAWKSTSGYMRGVAVIAVVDAVLIGIALVIIGVPLVIPLMVIVFFGAFIPLVGAITAGAIAALVALISEGPLEAVLVVAAITAIQQVEGDLLYPNVVGRLIRLHPVTILLVLTAGTVIAGLIGALLSVPVAAAVWTAADYVRRGGLPPEEESEPEPEPPG